MGCRKVRKKKKQSAALAGTITQQTELKNASDAVSDADSEFRQAVLKNPGKERSRIERKITKLEEELSASEESLAQLQEQYNDPAFSADFQKLGELQERMKEEEEKQEELLGQIMEQEEALAEIMELLQ